MNFGWKAFSALSALITKTTQGKLRGDFLFIGFYIRHAQDIVVLREKKRGKFSRITRDGARDVHNTKRLAPHFIYVFSHGNLNLRQVGFFSFSQHFLSRCSEERELREYRNRSLFCKYCALTSRFSDIKIQLEFLELPQL